MNFEELIQDTFASINKDDLRILLPILASANPKRILEIGAWHGYSANLWINAFNPDKFITIEIDESQRFLPIDESKYQMWYGSDSHDPQTLNTLKIYLPEIDLLFIDGDHTLEGVKKDWEMYGPLVRRGGVVVFHDAIYRADDVQVNILWQELKQKYPYVEIKSKESTGTGVLYV